MRRLLSRFADLLFSDACYLCRGPLEDAAAPGLLCAACDADLPRLEPPQCPRCGLPADREEVCGRCVAEPPPYDATVAALAYRFPADVIVHAVKYRGELALARLLGELLAARCAGLKGIDCVIPVPLAPARLAQRGFNQAVEIARPLAARLGVRLDTERCTRPRDTPAQTELAFEHRRSNVRDAFRCDADLNGARVAIVDDVMTTGATLAELARTLKRAGAQHVVNCVAVRTPSPSDAPATDPV